MHASEDAAGGQASKSSPGADYDYPERLMRPVGSPPRSPSDMLQGVSVTLEGVCTFKLPSNFCFSKSTMLFFCMINIRITILKDCFKRKQLYTELKYKKVCNVWMDFMKHGLYKIMIS